MRVTSIRVSFGTGFAGDRVLARSPLTERYYTGQLPPASQLFGGFGITNSRKDKVTLAINPGGNPLLGFQIRAQLANKKRTSKTVYLRERLYAPERGEARIWPAGLLDAVRLDVAAMFFPQLSHDEIEASQSAVIERYRYGSELSSSPGTGLQAEALNHVFRGMRPMPLHVYRTLSSGDTHSLVADGGPDMDTIRHISSFTSSKMRALARLRVVAECIDAELVMRATLAMQAYSLAIAIYAMHTSTGLPELIANPTSSGLVEAARLANEISVMRALPFIKDLSMRGPYAYYAGSNALSIALEAGDAGVANDLLSEVGQ